MRIASSCVSTKKYHPFWITNPPLSIFSLHYIPWLGLTHRSASGVPGAVLRGIRAALSLPGPRRNTRSRGTVWARSGRCGRSAVAPGPAVAAPLPPAAAPAGAAPASTAAGCPALAAGRRRTAGWPAGTRARWRLPAAVRWPGPRSSRCCPRTGDCGSLRTCRTPQDVRDRPETPPKSGAHTLQGENIRAVNNRTHCAYAAVSLGGCVRSYGYLVIFRTLQTREDWPVRLLHAFLDLRSLFSSSVAWS